MFHIFCIAHIIHNCALRIKTKFEKIDKLIAIIKLITCKNATNRALLNAIEQLPIVIVTRWNS